MHTDVSPINDDAAVARRVVSLRVESADLAAWKRAAKSAGVTLSDYIVRRVNGTTITIEPPPPPVDPRVGWRSPTDRRRPSAKPKRGR